jgi:hypothetical protein
LVAKLETKKTLDAEAAWSELKPLGEAVVPYLAEGYSRMKMAEGRLNCVFHSLRYGRCSEAAFRLGVAALRDRAAFVRYRACGLLAYSLRRDALPHLRALLSHSDDKTVENARAAIDAIESQNHHYFCDRDHSGRSFWEVDPGDVMR